LKGVGAAGTLGLFRPAEKGRGTMGMATGLDRDQIAGGLRRIGLAAGMGVMVHSSLKSFGHVEGGAPAVIGALMDVLTESGTLLLPSFNHFAPWQAGGAGLYDPALTPTSNGIIPETFRRMPGVWRSLNPSHPYAAWGANAERYTVRHHLTLTMGPDSPLGMLWREGGYGLFLGTGYGTNTFKHVVETSVGVTCLGRRTEELPARLPDGRMAKLRTWSFRRKTCPITDPAGPAEAEMGRHSLHARGKVGDCTLTFFRLADCFEVLSGMLRAGYGAHPPCAPCRTEHSYGPYTVESDWDAERECLRPDSPSRGLGPMADPLPPAGA
jgi:aminoglycoside N3'-acetyltransferase